MLRFDLFSPLPRVLSANDLFVLASVLSQALKIRAASSISLSFVSEARMRAINARVRGQDHPTDVLSFATAEEVRNATPKAQVRELGDVFICSVYASREARRRGIDEREELVRLLIHGVLHIQGYDHASEEEEVNMFGKQERLVERFYDLSFSSQASG